MKTLSVWQPHASLIAIGAKGIETRGWATSFRGQLAIHASKAFSRKQRDIATSEPFWTHFHPVWAANFGDDRPILGAVIATCNLVDVLKIDEDGLFQVMRVNQAVVMHLLKAPLPDEPELSFGDYTPGRYAWILENVRPLPEPIPATGHQRLWNWEPPEGVEID